MSVTASIVVNTFNRARALERLLPSLAQLDGAFEVVVVNGPSTDDTVDVLARHAHVLKTVTCPTANLSRSRNLGIAAAAGEIVVFIDDDALPGDRAWLTTLAAAFTGAQAASVGAAGGPSLHRDSEWPEFAGGWTSDYAEQRFADAGVPESGRWTRRTVGNNSAFRRSALVAIGGFDERFPYYLDEADVCLRLARAGYETVYLPAAPVRHYPAMSPIGPPFIRNRRLIARSDTYYCLKNGRDGWWTRVWTTLRLARHKHFVTEVPALVAQGRLTPREARAIRWQWLRGVAEGLVLGLWSRRATTLTAAPPPPCVPYKQDLAPPRLRIALCARRVPPDPQAGGVGRYTWALARGLFERGHEVTIITESETPVARVGLGFEVVGVRERHSTPGLSQTPVLAGNIGYAEAVAHYVRGRQDGPSPFDVVHATTWGIEACGVAAWGGVPLTMMLVTPLESVMAAEQWAPSQDLLANVWLDQWTVEAAHRVCTPSSRVVATYAARDGWSGREVHPVALGTVLAPPAPRRPDGCRRLLFVGRHERRKGIHVLLEVLPGLLERHPSWTCTLVGNHSVVEAGGATFAQRFLDRHAGAHWLPRVVFAGPASEAELAAHYARADVFAAPSLFESFGLIYLEAMQHGVPVVGTTAGGVPDVVRDGVDGLLVPPGDAAALGAALDRMMGDDVLRRRLGRAAAESLATRTHVAMADRMVGEYRAAIAAHGVQRRVPAWDGAGALAPVVLRLLEHGAATRGLSLACRAATAFEAGAREDASRLIAEALGLTGHPDYYAMAIELALVDDPAGAVDLAARGFAAMRDDSDACLVCAATLMATPDPARRAPAGWPEWLAAHKPRLADRMLAAATAAVRASRDVTAAALLEACRADAGDSPRVFTQATYHLASVRKRLGRTGEARGLFDELLTAGRLPLLELPMQAAVYFHAGELAMAAGDTARAADYLSSCVAILPGHARAQARLLDARAALAA
jgi:glycosyltransferase involved in cell wall biosynthesis/GT2 family glycosyltransferase